MNPVTIPPKPDQPLTRALTLHRLHLRAGGSVNMRTVNAVIFDTAAKEQNAETMTMAVLDEDLFIAALRQLFPQMELTTKDDENFRICKEFIARLAKEQTDGEIAADDLGGGLENDAACAFHYSTIEEARGLIEHLDS